MQSSSQSASQSVSGVDERKDAKTLAHADIETDGDGEEGKGRREERRKEGGCMTVCLTVSAVSRD